MPNLTKKIYVYNDGSIDEESIPQTELPQSLPFWRVYHWVEYGNSLRSRPEVERFNPGISCNFGESWQKVSYRINKTENPMISASIAKKQWRAVYGYKTAFMNGTGFDESGDPRADFINQLNLKAPLPKWDQPRCCGGAVLTGVETYSVTQLVIDSFQLIKAIVRKPRSFAGKMRSAMAPLLTNNMLVADTMNGNKDAIAAMEELRIKYGETTPVGDPVVWLLAHPWLMFDAVNCRADGLPARFPQGTNGNRVFIPLVSSKPVQFPLNKLQKLPSFFNFATYNPYKIGYP